MQARKWSTVLVAAVVVAAGLQGPVGCESAGPATPDPPDPPPPTTGAVNGVISSDAGGTVAGAIVTLARQGFASMTATSDAAGSFAFPSVEAGQWQASVAPVPGFRAGTGSSAAVTVVANQTASVDLELEVEPLGAAVGGRVLSGGNGIEGATIVLDGAGGNVGQTVSDSNGDYRFAGLDAGTYTVTVTPPAGFQVAQGDSASRTLTVDEGATGMADFALQREALSGTVIINLINFAFSDPNGSNTTVVRVGSTVRWVQTTGTFHTVTPDNHSQFTSQNMPAGAPSFEVTFNTEGTFAYFCNPHRGAGMVGTIEVVP